MSKYDRVSPPVDAQADLSARDRAEVDMAAERASLEAAILRFNVNYNPNGGPPKGRDLPRLASPPNRGLGNPPVLPPRVAGGGPPQGQAQGGGQPGLLQQQPLEQRERIRSLGDGGVDRTHVNPNPDANTKESKYGVFHTLDQDLIDPAVYI